VNEQTGVPTPSPMEKRENELLEREAAEVCLLLDFLVGRADRPLIGAPQDGPAQAFSSPQDNALRDRKNHDAAQPEIGFVLSDQFVRQVMAAQCPTGRRDFAKDATFLLRAREVLNARAAPASGSTIAYTLLVVNAFLLESADFSVIFLQPVTFAHGRESTARRAGRVR
jgi:hypothetical protein